MLGLSNMLSLLSTSGDVIHWNGLKKKIKGDIDKCFDEAKTGVPINQIAKIIYCHASSNLSAGTDNELKQYCADRGVELEIIGIDSLADKLCHEYPGLAKDHLGLAADTEQIQSVEDYVKYYWDEFISYK